MKEESLEQPAQKTLDEDTIRELVSIRAYELFLGRGSEPGKDLDDWLQAEQDVLSSLSETEGLNAQEAIIAKTNALLLSLRYERGSQKPS